MSRAIAWALAGALLGLAGCGEAGERPAPPGRLVVSQVRVGASLYPEGSVPYLRLQDAAGTVLLERGFRGQGGALIRRRLVPGRYTVVSWQRPCDGNCGYLDPPIDRCRGTIVIASAHITRVSVRLRPGGGCRIASSK